MPRRHPPLVPWLVLLALGLWAAAAAADEFVAFRIPDHDWRSASAECSGFLERGSVSQHWFYTDRDDRGRGGHGALALGGERGFDGERLQLGVSGAALLYAAGWRDEGVDVYTFPATMRVATRTQRAEFDRNFDATASLRAYPGRSAIGLGLQAALLCRVRDHADGSDGATPGWTDADRVESRDRYRETTYQYEGGLTLTIGVGRVRDATVVEDVHVLVERLRESGALARAPSPAACEKLAGVLVVMPRVGHAHERPERFVWREVERVLREDGALAGPALDAYGVLRAREPYRRLRQALMGGRRRIGAFVGPALELRHQHEIQRWSSAGSQREFSGGVQSLESQHDAGARGTVNLDRVLGGAVAEWHRPVGWRWQWDASARVLFLAVPGARGLTANEMVSADWHVADRWQAGFLAMHERAYTVAGSRRDATTGEMSSVSVGAELDYAVEDHVELTLAVEDRQYQQSDEYFGGEYLRQRQGEVRVGVRYRFLGRVAAPGLFEAMRPIR